LNLLRPRTGRVHVFGFDPARQEVEVKKRLSYVPDQVAFYPCMTVRETLDEVQEDHRLLLRSLPVLMIATFLWVFVL
jgi:ABC-type multidrug transport system ATPase subunit